MRWDPQELEGPLGPTSGYGVPLGRIRGLGFGGSPTAGSPITPVIPSYKIEPPKFSEKPITPWLKARKF